MKRVAIAASIVLTLQAAVHAAMESLIFENGMGPPKYISLVYATITAVSDRRELPRGARLEITLDVKATLMGPYDAAANPTHTFDLCYGIPYPYVGRPPFRPGHKVIVFLTRGYWSREAMERGKLEPLPPDIVFDGFVPFMPGEKPLAMVTNLDDPTVVEIIAKLRRVCRKGETMRRPWLRNGW